jgi:hypothetical protein
MLLLNTVVELQQRLHSDCLTDENAIVEVLKKTKA